MAHNPKHPKWYHPRGLLDLMAYGAATRDQQGLGMRSELDLSFYFILSKTKTKCINGWLMHLHSCVDPTVFAVITLKPPHPWPPVKDESKDNGRMARSHATFGKPRGDYAEQPAEYLKKSLGTKFHNAERRGVFYMCWDDAFQLYHVVSCCTLPFVGELALYMLWSSLFTCHFLDHPVVCSPSFENPIHQGLPRVVARRWNQRMNMAVT